jgi:hypothetical protein
LLSCNQALTELVLILWPKSSTHSGLALLLEKSWASSVVVNARLFFAVAGCCDSSVGLSWVKIKPVDIRKIFQAVTVNLWLERRGHVRDESMLELYHMHIKEDSASQGFPSTPAKRAFQANVPETKKSETY